MDVDYGTLQTLRKTPPAWKLLVADHSPLIAAFLHHTFIVPNQRRLSRADLASALEDLLFTLRETQGEDAFPRSAQAYLDDIVFVDRVVLKQRIRTALQTRDQVTLAQILSDHPLEKGLAELVTYLTLAAEDDNAWFDDALTHRAVWTDAGGIRRQATFNAVIFSR